MPEQKKMVSSEELGKIIGKSGRTIQLLAKDDVLTYEKNKNKNEYNLYTAVKEYLDYLAKKSYPEISSLDEAKTAEEVRYKRAKADMMELELKELDGQMHSAEDVESLTTDLVLVVRSSLLSLPGRIGVDVAEVSTAAECSEIVKKAVCEVLEDLSKYEYDPEEYRKRVRERQGWKEQQIDEKD
ncbi:hypothetical protein [Lachnotalea glycerini]|uniref:Protoporphyrinogen oxidase n=1 Tax=Lachnotalea glycerini TaxID=1763509 RepID=A0A371JBP9_9FIRM|nr:hypothetical protein [Lachnotalea glycerini]RDY30179.1 protoporphyrinogen oxidase [Lachnotalea glycerini]